MPNFDTIDTTYGALLIALVLSTTLYGITLLQTFFYYRQYPNDTRLTKLIVFLLWVLDTAHAILCTITIYTYLVSNFNKPDALRRSTWSINAQADCNSVIGIIVQFFFAKRVWKMSRNIILTVVILILTCVHFGVGVGLTIKAFMSDLNSLPNFVLVAGIGLGSAAAADIMTAAALCHCLKKNRTGVARTDSVTFTLIMYSLTTGLLTSAIALMCLVTFATMPTNYIWIGFSWIIGKCYVNSLLAALNCRHSIREKVAAEASTFLPLTAAVPSIASTGDHSLAEPLTRLGTVKEP